MPFSESRSSAHRSTQVRMSLRCQSRTAVRISRSWPTRGAATRVPVAQIWASLVGGVLLTSRVCHWAQTAPVLPWLIGYARGVTEIALRELRNNTSEVLRRVENGEELDVTVNGRPVARLVPLPRRRTSLNWDEIRASQADTGLLVDLREMLGDETTDDIEDPWQSHSR